MSAHTKWLLPRFRNLLNFWCAYSSSDPQIRQRKSTANPSSPTVISSWFCFDPKEAQKFSKIRLIVRVYFPPNTDADNSSPAPSLTCNELRADIFSDLDCPQAIRV